MFYKWDAKRDTLLGFCGRREEHNCNIGHKVVVGIGEIGYEKIVSSFIDLTCGSYARVL